MSETIRGLGTFIILAGMSLVAAATVDSVRDALDRHGVPGLMRTTLLGLACLALLVIAASLVILMHWAIGACQ